MIHAPDAVVSLWEAEAVRALAAADRATAPAIVSDIARSPGGVIELVASLAGALTRAAGVLAGSVVQATPEGAAVFLDGVDRLARELKGEFSCDRCIAGEHGERIAVHSFEQRPCEHTRGDFSCCAAGDDGCEGDIAHHDLNSDPR